MLVARAKFLISRLSDFYCSYVLNKELDFKLPEDYSLPNMCLESSENLEVQQLFPLEVWGLVQSWSAVQSQSILKAIPAFYPFSQSLIAHQKLSSPIQQEAKPWSKWKRKNDHLWHSPESPYFLELPVSSCPGLHPFTASIVHWRHIFSRVSMNSSIYSFLEPDICGQNAYCENLLSTKYAKNNNYIQKTANKQN